VYRLEVGAACFALLYLATMAFLLALDGRGFAEFGTRGLRAVEVVRIADEQTVTSSRQMEINRKMKNDVERTEAAVQSAVKTLSRQEERLARLEREQLP
jgi:hypothetical protein